MTTRSRTRAALCLLAMAMAPLVLPAAGKGIAAQVPDMDARPPDTGKPVKVYILAGQSNMLEMGNVSGGNTRHTLFFTAAKGDDPGVEASAYPGAYSPTANYDEMTPRFTETIPYGGMGEGQLPRIDGDATHVIRGFLEVKKTGVYVFSPGYQNARHNVMEVEGREVYRREPGADAVQTPTPMTEGKRYPFKVTFLTKAADSLFWIGRVDIPGTLETVVKREKKFPHLIDEKGNWTARDDVYYYDARIKFQGRPLGVPERGGIGPELQFGHILGAYHDEQVLLIKTAMGNRALAWDFRPPSSGRLPDIKEDLKKWEGLEYRLMVEGVRKTLDNIAEILPNYKGQGYEIAGLAWFQGHKDGGKEEWIAEYESNLVNLIKDVRAEFRAPKLPVVVATVGFGGTDMGENYLRIREAQMAVSDPAQHPEFAGSVRTVDTRGFWRSVEASPANQGHHYNRNAETFLSVGDALGRGMVELLEGKR